MKDDILAWVIVLTIVVALLGTVAVALYLRAIYWTWILEGVT